MINVVQYYQSQGVQDFAIFGMCFGGYIGIHSAVELADYFKASAAVHPRSFTYDQAPRVRMPLYLMPSRDQPDMVNCSDLSEISFLFFTKNVCN